MSGDTAARVRRRIVSVVALFAVTIFLVGSTVLAHGAWQSGRLNSLICGGECGPSNVVAPDGLRSASAADQGVSPPVAESPADPRAVARAVRSKLGADVLGDHVGFAASGTTADGTVRTAGDKGAFTPASTTKLAVALAALLSIDPKTRFTTSVVDTGDRLVLVGGGDPFLTDQRDDDSAKVERAQLSVLADRTTEALRKAGRDSVSLGFDDSLFSGPAASPGWEASYVPGNIVTPVSALWVNKGLVDGIRSGTPADTAAQRFSDLLEDRGIEVSGEVEQVRAGDSGQELATVRSATLGQIVEAVVRTSNNEASEVLLRHIAIAKGEEASFAGGDKAVIATLKAAGVSTTGMKLFDGSGLSRKNKISPTTLVQIVRTALDTPRASAMLDDLPVSGFSGTLDDRMAGKAGGLVRAKTGTLTGVHSLAGYALDADGRPVVFAVMADRTDQVQGLAAQDALDKIVSAITTCSCG